MDNIKVALVGYGHLGKWHAEKANTLASLTYVVDPIEKNREAAKEKFPHVQVASNIEQVIDEVDAVLVVTPTKYHYEISRTVLEKGKHLFCEKPVTETLKQAKDLEKVCTDNQIVQVGHSERCHFAIENISNYKDYVQNSSVVKFQRVSSFKGRASDVSVIEDLMIHDIDLALLLFGMPKEVKAKGYKKHTENYDYCLAELIYEKRSVFVEASRIDVDEKREVKFHGRGGELKIDLLNLEVTTSQNLDSNNVQEIKKETYEKRDHLFIEQEKFYESIKNNTQVFVSLEDGIKAMEIIELIKKDLEN